MIVKPFLVLFLVAFSFSVLVLMVYYRPTLENAVASPIAQNSVDAPTVLSDTQGYDFSRYIGGVTNRVRYNWFSLIPEVAKRREKGRVAVLFTIIRNGGVQDLRLAASSGNQVLDRVATAAIEASNPFAALPSDFKGDSLKMQFSFLYNIKSEGK